MACIGDCTCVNNDSKEFNAAGVVFLTLHRSLTRFIDLCRRAVSRGLTMENCLSRHCPNTTVTGNISGLNLNSSLPVNEAIAMAGRIELSLVDILKLGREVLIAMFGVVSNVLVAIVISGLGKRKSTTDPLQIHCRPWHSVTIVPAHCYPDVFQGASVWYIAVVAVQRYWEIVLLRKPITSKANTRFVVVCVWLTSFLLFCLPLYFVVEYEDKTTGERWCGPTWPSGMAAQVYIVFLTILSYILPVIVISWTYLAV